MAPRILIVDGYEVCQRLRRERGGGMKIAMLNATPLHP
jgi:hypothetical protein